MSRLGSLLLDLTAGGIVGDRVAGVRGTHICHHAALLGQRVERVRCPVHRDLKWECFVTIPAKFFDKQVRKAEGFEVLAKTCEVNRHSLFPPVRFKQPEGAEDAWLLRLLFLMDQAEAVFIAQSSDQLGERLV